MGRVSSLAELSGKRVLVIGMGGGGDVVSATIIAFQLRRYRVDARIASILWERHQVDPKPGPIILEELINAEVLKGYALISGDTYALRSGRRVKLQASRIARVTGEEIIGLTLAGGVQGLVAALRSINRDLDVDTIIAVDVGGDVLGVGCEENLWSPLADQMVLSALAVYDRTSIVAIHGLSGDGELPLDYLTEALAKIARAGGLISVRGLERADMELLEALIEACETEASQIPLLAFKGEYGEVTMRRGTRTVTVNPLLAATFYIDAGILYDLQPLARKLTPSRSIEEAVDVAHRLGVYTEYDLEVDLERYKPKSPEELMTMWKRRKAEVKRESKSPIC